MARKPAKQRSKRGVLDVFDRDGWWWASVDVLTAAGAVEWYPASKGAKTPDGALRQLAREIIVERRAESSELSASTVA